MRKNALLNILSKISLSAKKKKKKKSLLQKLEEMKFAPPLEKLSPEELKRLQELVNKRTEEYDLHQQEDEEEDAEMLDQARMDAIRDITGVTPSAYFSAPPVSHHTNWPESHKDISRIVENLNRPGKKTREELGVKPEQGKENIKRVYNEATPEEKEYWGTWYENAGEEVREIANRFKLPFDVVAAVTATLSPGINWKTNLTATIELLKGSKTIPGAYSANVQKARVIKNSLIPNVSGPKVTIFYESLLNPKDTHRKIVLDGHAINVWMGKRLPIKFTPSTGKKLKEKIISDYKQAADEMGVPPQAVQAVTWYIWKCTPIESITEPAID